MDPASIPAFRLYGELADLWPLVSTPEEYAEEASHWRRTLRDVLGAGRLRLLELGVGGGHNLSHFAAEHDVVALDSSARMLEHSRRLNPGVDHRVGDMRTVRLGREFDAVLVHDAINHLLTEEDLRATMRTAAAHLRPGGALIAAIELDRDSFRPPVVDCRTRTRAGVQLTYVEYTHDPDPTDTAVEALVTYFVVRDGALRIELDRLLIGLFALETWRAAAEQAGLAFELRTFSLAGEPEACRLLVGRRS